MGEIDKEILLEILKNNTTNLGYFLKDKTMPHFFDIDEIKAMTPKEQMIYGYLLRLFWADADYIPIVRRMMERVNDDGKIKEI